MHQSIKVQGTSRLAKHVTKRQCVLKLTKPDFQKSHCRHNNKAVINIQEALSISSTYKKMGQGGWVFFPSNPSQILLNKTKFAFKRNIDILGQNQFSFNLTYIPKL